jgi:hypothetical protein
MQRQAGRTHVAAVAVTVALLSGCAQGETARVADSATPAAAPATASPSTLTIVASDFAYEAPDTITAGMVTMRMVNKGQEFHHVQVMQLKDGKTFADFTSGLKTMKPGDPLPPWIANVAGPTQGDTEGVIQELAPGNYVLICVIPSPSDKVPHFAKGMMRPLTVIPASAPVAAAPASDVNIVMTDYNWTVTPTLSAGKHVIRIENAAAQPHETFFMRLAPGKTIADVSKWAATEVGPPPGDALGGTSGMDNGTVVYVPIDLTPGEYAMVCFIPDAKDGKPHLAHGMIKAFTVQ